MPDDVSRVAYDAALKRVRDSMPCQAPCDPGGRCWCARLTLAALGLDEPPTEATTPAHTQECEDRAFIFHASTGGDAPCICGAVVPPTETPKACPTCEGPPHAGWEETSALIEEHNRRHGLAGSGIDGGTP